MKLLVFILIQKRTFDSIYREFGYHNGRIGKYIKQLISENKIEFVEETCQWGGLRMKFRIVK